MEFDAKQQFADTQVVSLATVSPEGAPHLVPVVFAVVDDFVYTAVDAKRKTTHRLRRLRNIEQNPHVCLLADHYDEDWDRLWWVRADGTAQIYDRGEEMAAGYDHLRRKYVQYERISLTGPVLRIVVDHWSSWHA